jgi:hypothetical protein
MDPLIEGLRGRHRRSNIPQGAVVIHETVNSAAVVHLNRPNLECVYHSSQMGKAV